MAKAATKTSPAPAADKAAPAPAEETKNLPAKASTTAVSTADAEFFGASQGIGSGFENVTADDLLVPRLTILQGLSPQVTKGKPEYDEAARVGDIYDVGLQERFEEVTVLVVAYLKVWLEWAPRSTGKGLIETHEDATILDKCEENDKGQMVLPNGNYIVETAQFYCLNLSADGRKSFIPMASTQLKKARRLLTLATGEKVPGPNGPVTPPIFYRAYTLTTVPESNNEGNWMGWKIERSVALTDLPNWKEILADVKSFREALSAGRARGDLTGVDGGGEASPSGNPADDTERM